MRKLAAVALLGALFALSGGAAHAAGVTVNTTVRFEFTDCASGGSSAQTVTAGSYLFRVTDADTFVCWAATCASGGEKVPQGTVLLLVVPLNQSFSCRSASGSSGDVIFTRGS